MDAPPGHRAVRPRRGRQGSRTGLGAVGRRIGANIDGASAAILLDLGLKLDVARVLIVTPRTVGLAAHYLEEVEQGNTWRHVPVNQVAYTGPMPSDA